MPHRTDPAMYQLHHEEPMTIPEGRATLTVLDSKGHYEPGEGIWLHHRTVAFDVVEPEDTSWPAMATQYPVEDGRNISDHVHLQPITVELTGIITGEDASTKIAMLRKWRNNRWRVRYEGRNIFGKYIITGLDTVHSYRVRQGFSFSITLTEVRITAPQVVETKGDDPSEDTADLRVKPGEAEGLPGDGVGSESGAGARVVSTETGIASWYGGSFHGGPTASGETYNMHSMTAAHKTLPFNTRVEVERVSTGKKVIVRINNRGPFIAGRIIDLSVAAAKALGSYEAGITQVIVRRLG